MEGPAAIQGVVRNFRPFSSQRVLRPFLDTYRIVGDQLERRDPDARFDEAQFVDSCMGLAKQYHLQRRIQSAAPTAAPARTKATTTKTARMHLS